MRPSFVKTAIALMIGVSASSPAVFASDWNGSYAASGQCFCVGNLPGATRKTIVPTPVGGQTVSQVCSRLGEGPGLLRVNGRFNHPVYEDAQCGNGPGLAVNTTVSGSCSESIDGGVADTANCPSPGPRWNMEGAFAHPAAKAPTRPASLKKVVAAVYRSSSLAMLGKPVTSSRARPVTVANRSLAGTPPAGSQWVMIDGQRYIRARDGMPAAGGEPGQRIVLDGLVYLRDDGKLDPADLFLDKVQNQPPGEGSGKNSEKADTDATSDKSAANSSEDKVGKLRQENARRVAALQQREDSRATARQIEIQRRRVLQDAAAAQSPRPMSPAEELSLAKQELEQESASRALVVLQARAEEQAIEREKMRKLAAAASANEEATASVNTDLPPAEPLMTAAMPEVVLHASNRNFRYLEALPVNYDVGGNGVMLEASTSSHSRLQYFGRVGIAHSYSEAMAGVGYYLTPESASRLTFVLLAGIEYGNFELHDGQSPEISVDFDDTGAYLAASSRMLVNNRFELKAGVAYSTLFEGDAMAFGGAYLHLSRNLDLLTRFELGDNDLLGIGVRYYY